MHTKLVKFVSTIICLFLAGGLIHAAEKNADKGLWFFVLVKSNNYAQNVNGDLTLLNYHFFSEIFLKQDGVVKTATLARAGHAGEVFTYEDKGDAYYFEGGHFDTLEEVDAAHPNGNYQFRIELTSGEVIDKLLTLEGPDGKTDIPEPIRISFYQGDKLVSPDKVDSKHELKVKWSPYSNGRSDPNRIVDDMIFVVFQDCHGERIFHTGLPFEEDSYMTYETTEVTVPAGRFKPGQAYSMFVEFPHVVESGVDNGVPGFTSYATATYLDVRSLGNSAEPCPDKMPPLDTGQTDRMDIES